MDLNEKKYRILGIVLFGVILAVLVSFGHVAFVVLMWSSIDAHFDTFVFMTFSLFRT